MHAAARTRWARWAAMAMVVTVVTQIVVRRFGGCGEDEEAEDGRGGEDVGHQEGGEPGGGGADG